MPYIQGRHGGRSAVVRVAIVDAARRQEHRQSKSAVLAGVSPYNALIDTGATSTMISSRVVQDQKLEPVNKLKFHGLDGISWKTGYLFHVAFYDDSFRHSLFQDDGDQHVIHQETPVDKIHIYNQPINGGELTEDASFDVLLGMDVITSGVLRIDKNGQFSFRF